MVFAARGWHVLITLLSLLLVASLLPLTASAARAAGEDTSRLQSVAPARVMDTRDGTGVPAGQRARGSIIDLNLAGQGLVPANATAVVMNVTITGSLGPGFVQVFPTGQAALGSSSNLNVERAGQTIPNLVTVPIGDGGKVSFLLHAGGHLLADVFGYYESAATASDGRFTALSPVRLLDTRDRTGMSASPAYPGDTKNCGDFATWSQANAWFWTYYYDFGDVARLDGDGDLRPCQSLPGTPTTAQPLPEQPKPMPAAGSATPVRVLGAGGVPSAGVSAVALNVTATAAGAPGYVQAVPTGGQTPYGASSNLNLERAGQTIANLVIVPVGAGGSIDLYTMNPTHIIADVVGYFTDSSARSSTEGLFVPRTPARLLDTRDASHGTPRLGAGQELPFLPLGRGGIPTEGVSAVLYNVTATNAGGPGYVQVFPTGQANPGSSSNLNLASQGQTIPNAVLAATGNDGYTSIYTMGDTDLILDAAGYYTGSSSQPGPGLEGLVIAAPHTATPYNRDEWSVWDDVDGDCLDTRAEVLIEESAVPVGLSADGCRVVTGRWLGPYSGDLFTLASDVDVDHTVPLANAHRSGGWRWSAGEKARYGNDLAHAEHLIAIDDGLNMSKSDRSPDEWAPPLASSHCTYANDWISIKKRWGLTVTVAEHDALARMIGTCS